MESLDTALIASDDNLQNQFIDWLDSQSDISRIKTKLKSTWANEQALAFFWEERFEIEFLDLLVKKGVARRKEINIRRPFWEFMGDKHPPMPIGSYEAAEQYRHYIEYKEEALERFKNQDYRVAEDLEKRAEEIRRRSLIIGPNMYGVFMPQNIGLHYLSLCASKAAATGKRDLAAGETQYTDVVFYNKASLRGEVATAVLELYLPENFQKLSPGCINEVRKELAGQRLKYQQAIQRLCEEFEVIASEGQLENMKDRLIDLAKERIEETKKTYKRARLDIAIRTLSVSLTPPALATSIASALGVGIFAPAGIATALSLFAATTLLNLDKARDERAKRPWSYVLEASKIR